MSLNMIGNIAGRLYRHKCDVIEMKSQKGEINNTMPVTVLENIPCRISFSSSPANSRGKEVSSTGQKARLFLAPDVNIKAGSRIIVSGEGFKTEYECAGTAAVYESHQEIDIILRKQFA